MEQETAVDISEMARILGVSESTVRVKAIEGDIPSFRIGRLWRFWPSEVREHLRREAERRDPWRESNQARARRRNHGRR